MRPEWFMVYTTLTTSTSSKWTPPPRHSYSNQTGKITIKSKRGNLYIFILYIFGTNTIHEIAIPNRQTATIWNAWQNTFNTLMSNVHPIKHHFHDNKCPTSWKQLLQNLTLNIRLHFFKINFIISQT